MITVNLNHYDTCRWWYINGHKHLHNYSHKSSKRNSHHDPRSAALLILYVHRHLYLYNKYTYMYYLGMECGHSLVYGRSSGRGLHRARPAKIESFKVPY
jgi:hypothetical protein